MATIAKLAVELSLDDNAFTRGIDSARERVDKLASSARKWGGILTTGVTLPLAAAGVGVVRWASDLEQTLGATEQLWGANANSIIDWSKTADRSMGMTQDQALTSMNRFNAMFKQMSSDSSVIRDMSEDFTQLSADLSAMWGGSSIEAADMLTSALRGNYEGLDRYNINLTEALVNQEAMNIAVANGRDEITEADKVQARYNLVMEQSADAQGQFARETNTTAGRMAIASARAKNLATSFGRLLLPATNSILDAASRLLDFIEKLTPAQQKWAIGIAAVAAAIGPLLLVIGMLLPGLSALLAVLGFLVSPIGLVVAAVGLLAFVFRDELGAALDWIMDKVGEFLDLWRDFKSQGLDPVQAALVALAAMFPALGVVIAPLRQMVENLGDAFRAIRDGNYGQALDSIIAAFRNLGSAIKAAWNSISWSAIVSALGDLAGALAVWLWDQASAVDWGGVISSAASAAGDITDTIVNKLGDLTAALAGWVLRGASAVPWGSLIAVGASINLGDVVGSIVSNLGDLATGLDTWWRNAIDSVDWGSLGFLVGEKVGDLSRVLAPKALEMLQGFSTVLTDPGTWSTIGMVLLALMLALPAAIGYLGETLGPKAAEFLQGFVTGLDINWYLVSMWMLTMPVKLIDAVGDLSATLVGKGVEVITGLYNGMVQQWPTVAVWLLLTGLRAFQAVGSLTSTLVARGTELIQGFLVGAVDKWSFDVLPFLKDRGSQAFNHVGSLGTTLVSKGRDLITGFLTGVMAKWTDVSSFLRGIPGAAITAVGSLGSVLYSAGASLLQGLIDGINSKIGSLTSTLSGITSLIPDWKGPPEKDAVLLEESGRLIMGGLMGGLDDGWQDVKRQLSDYTSAIGGSMNADMGGDYGANGSNSWNQRPIQIITLEPGKWKEFLDNAMAGGDFARNAGPELAMYGGKA